MQKGIRVFAAISMICAIAFALYTNFAAKNKNDVSHTAIMVWRVQ